MAYAAIFACDDKSHWRYDLKDEEALNPIVEKISRILKQLLWFHDEELGFIDPFTRQSFLNRLLYMASNWGEIDYIRTSPLCRKSIKTEWAGPWSHRLLPRSQRLLIPWKRKHWHLPPKRQIQDLLLGTEKAYEDGSPAGHNRCFQQEQVLSGCVFRRHVHQQIGPADCLPYGPHE
mmetsp:Transcript_341/g.405  ORF Transcript_341/g.405 Transcript_341/m.405 type:complete len:176 (+) Transcript_341:70-597(+)